jgi:hypothetical protein
MLIFVFLDLSVKPGMFPGNAYVKTFFKTPNLTEVRCKSPNSDFTFKNICADLSSGICAAFRKNISVKADVAVDILKGSTIVGCMFSDTFPLKWPCSPFSPNLN